MKIIYFDFITFLLVSCSSSESNNLAVNERNENKVKLGNGSVKLKTVENTMVSDTVLVELSNTISLHWSNQSYSIVEDSLFNAVASSFPEKQMSFVALISNTTKTRAIACGVNKGLLAGDIAFLLINKVKMLPYFDMLGVQWDAYEKRCEYPLGMFDYINNNRGEVRQKVESYIVLNG